MGIGMLRRYYREAPEPEGPEFTAAAADLLKAEGIAEADYDGEATGATGNVLKSDVEAWLEGQEA